MYCIYDNLRTQLVLFVLLPPRPPPENPSGEGVRESVCVFVFRASLLHSRVAPYVNYERVAAYLLVE